VSTTLNGLANVRAFGAQNLFESQYYRYQNDHSATWFLFVCSVRTLGLVMDWICIGYIVTIAFVLMIFHDGMSKHYLNSIKSIIALLNVKLKGVSGGSAGLVFSSALMLTEMTQYGVKQSAELESQMTAVERIIEYSKLEEEADLESSADNKPDKE
jgi:ATP-binding cassette subfamily C (CFTR/MRP) protein 4